MQTSSQDIIRVARSWIGVPFAHQGRSEQGVDCLGLLVMVADKLQLSFAGKKAAMLDDTHYGHRPCTATLLKGLTSALQPVQKAQICEGDILLLNIDNRPQHLAIVGDYPQKGCFSMIHAYAPSRKVVEHRLCESWQKDIFAAFRLPNICV